jgi:hypothetical protein
MFRYDVTMRLLMLLLLTTAAHANDWRAPTWLRGEVGRAWLNGWTHIDPGHEQRVWGNGPQFGLALGTRFTDSFGAKWLASWAWSDDLTYNTGPQAGSLSTSGFGVGATVWLPAHLMIEVDLMLASGTLEGIDARPDSESTTSFAPCVRVGYDLALAPEVSFALLAGVQWFNASDDIEPVTSTDHLIVTISLALDVFLSGATPAAK